MPALSFKKEFSDAVEAGTKLQTIRQVWKRPIKVGDTVFLKSGMRTKKCRPLGEGVVTSVEPISIHRYTDMRLSGKRLDWDERNNIAEADGFYGDQRSSSQYQLLDFFDGQYGLPFEGVLIKWRLK